MSEIVLSFFAVIGITLTMMHFLDYIFYRKSKIPSKLFLDLRKKSEEEIIEMLETVCTVRGRKSGAAVIGILIVVISKNGSISKNKVYRYLRAFNIVGTVYEDEEDWLADFV